MVGEQSIADDSTVWLIQNPHDVSLLMRSSDGGAHWDFVGGALQESEIIDSAWTDSTLLFLGAEGTLWSSDDGAETWSSNAVMDTEVEATSMEAVAGTIFVGTKEGAFLGQTGDLSALSMVLDDVEIRTVAFSATDPAILVAGTKTGAIYRSADGGESFSELQSLPGGRQLWSLAELGGRLFAGSDGKLLFADVELLDTGAISWDLCGDLPGNAPGTYSDDVVVVDITSDAHVIAASGTEAMFISEDGCDSWEVLPAEDNIHYSGIGNASTPDEAFVDLDLEGNIGLTAGFNGVKFSNDAGTTFRTAKLLPEDYTKGVAFAPNFPTDPRLFTVGYGGGVHWTDDFGASWSGSAAGVSGAYSNGITPAEDYADSGAVYYSGSNKPYKTEDGGQTWSPVNLPMQRVRQFRTDGDRVYALGEDQVNGIVGQVAYSDDSGETWEEFTNLYATMDQGAPRDLRRVRLGGKELLLLVVDSPAGFLTSDDEGDSWTWQYRGETEPAAGVEVWPNDDGDRLVFATPEAGILVSDDDGSSWSTPANPPDGHIRHLFQTDDGTLFSTNRQGVIFRSKDGGDAWKAVSDPIAPAIYCFDVAPDFAQLGVAMLGTQAGIYYTEDGGDSWQLLPRFERFEADTYHLTCDRSDTRNPEQEDTGQTAGASEYSNCDDYVIDDAGLGGGYLMHVGDQISFTFEGHSFQVIGPKAAGFQMTIDGVAAGTLDHDDDLMFTDLETGWHDVVLTLKIGPDSGTRVDVVEAYGAGTTMSVEPADEPDTDTELVADTGNDSDRNPMTTPGTPDVRCGCGTGPRSTTPWLIIGLLVLPICRRLNAR